MAKTPFLYQLYRRSRYASVETDAGTPGSRHHNQSEVFAVAALGFVLRHEPRFLDHFLHKVCGLDKRPPGECEIRCQDGNQSDLAIVWPGHSVVVVEAKIGAELQPHQNPSMTEFHAAPSGYGVQIQVKYPDEKDRYYLVLARDVSAILRGDCRNSSPKFRGFLQWGELAGMAAQPDVVTDFLDSLGALGIPELQLRSFSNMRLEKNTGSAADIFTLLDGLAKSFNITGRKGRLDVQVSPEVKFVGVNIPPGGKFAELSQCVGPSAETIGWFGYESPHDGEPRITVWFNPENQRAGERAKKFVSTKLPAEKLHERDLSFYVTRNADSKLDDITWFQDILGKLSDVGRRK
jgi:hypothetical protein